MVFARLRLQQNAEPAVSIRVNPPSSAAMKLRNRRSPRTAPRLYCPVVVTGKVREFTTSSPEETIALGRNLAQMLTPPKVILLRGDLGAGKTTLVKGIAHAFDAASEDDVTSPTFTLIHEYRGPKATLYHIDLYRVDTQRELETLGLDDLIGENHILLIEWGEKFPRFQRERDLEIALERTGENDRRIVLTR